MIKNISRIIAVLGTVLIIFSASPMDVHATEYDYSGYTQDDYKAMIEERCKELGIDINDYKTTGGLVKVVLLLIIWMVHSRTVLQQMIQLLYQKLNQKQFNQQKTKHQKKSQNTSISIMLT